MKRSRVSLVLAALVISFVAVAASAQQSATGYWAGSYTGTSNCPSGAVVTPISGTFDWWIFQNGSSIRGAILISGLVDHDESCNATIMPDELMVFSGTRSGDYLALTLTDANGEQTAVDALISGDTISFSSSDPDGSISATATRQNVTVGPATGQWDGTYVVAETCLNKTIPYGGIFQVSLVQVGSHVVGLAFLDHVAMVEPPSCVVVGYTQVEVPIDGTVSGRSFTGSIFGLAVTGTFDGTSFTGSFSGEGLVGTFDTAIGGTPVQIDSFVASPVRIRSGGSSMLTWSTSRSVGNMIDGIGAQPPSGSVPVGPTSTTTYTLTAHGADGSQATATATVEVITSAEVVVTSRPKGMVAIADSGSASDSYVLFNRGGSSTNVALSQTGTFFTQSPTSFTLDPGQSRTISITGLPQAAGSYEGSSMPTGDGVASGLAVPIRMVATPATTGANVTTVAARVDVSGPAGTNPSGSVEFQNDGSAAVTGVLMSDVPWIVPDSGSITIPAGGTASASFTIDRSARSSYGSPNGSATGTLRFSTLTGGAAAKMADGADPRPLNGTSVTSTLVTIVDTAAPTTSSTTIPPLATGESALFVPGVASASSSLDATDIAITNRSGGTAVSNVDLYFTNTSGATKKAAAGAIQPCESLAFANTVNTVFGATSATGTLQLRSTNLDDVLFSASRASNETRASLPVFRSDDGVAPGGSIALTGLSSASGISTTIFIQEVSGQPTSIAVDYYDGGGSAVGSSGTFAVAAWSLTTIDSAIPPTAVSALVTNQSGGSNAGSLVAYASIRDETSHDRWNIVGQNADELGESLLPYLVPSIARRRLVVRPGMGTLPSSTRKTGASVFNPSSASATATLEFANSHGDETAKTLALGAHQTASYDNLVSQLFGGGQTGVAIVEADAAAPAVAVRIASSGSNGGTIGMAIPQVFDAPVLTLGSSTAFANLSDLTSATIASGAAGKKTSSFGIVETFGAGVTVRVTMSFADPRWLMAASQSRDYTLGPREMVVVARPGLAILGTSRDDLVGDLDDIQLQFQVVDGAGSAAVFVIETDNASGDQAFRIR